MDLTDIYRAIDPEAAKETFFSVAYGPFSKEDVILGYKAGLSKYKMTKYLLVLCKTIMKSK
jgi:hypothetical protein